MEEQTSGQQQITYMQ